MSSIYEPTIRIGTSSGRAWARSNVNLLIQGLLLVGTIVLIWSALSNGRANLKALGITSGFAFLDRATGWAYSFSLVPRSIDDSYAQTLWIGFMNTLFVGFISIFPSTILGFAIGSLRSSSKLGLQALSSVYVQIFRNIPLILQLVFWYSVLIHLPGPRQSFTFMDTCSCRIEACCCPH